jgi:hypothetical protein
MEEKLLGSLVLLVLPGNREGDTQVVQNIHERVSADSQSSCLESTLNAGQL